MLKVLLVYLSIAVSGADAEPKQERMNEVPVSIGLLEPRDDARVLYDSLGLEQVVKFDAFKRALTGYVSVENPNKKVLTIIDFTKPSSSERLAVVDMSEYKVLYTSLVSHGRNSGDKYATSFSNKVGSFQSSLGFYVTETTYHGRNGYSLILDGVEKGINDKAKERAIVMHGSKYVTPQRAQKGNVGRSLGCPALPYAITKPIIDAIKGGSLLYIHADSEEYMAMSPVLSEVFTEDLA